MDLLQEDRITSGTRSANDPGITGEKNFALLDAVPVPVIYITPDHKYLYANTAYAGWFGKKPNDIIGKTVLEFLGPRPYELLKPGIEKTLKGEITHTELELPFNDTSRFIDAYFTPDFDQQGKVRGLIAVINNVTEKKQIEKDLDKKSQQLRDYVENASIGLHWVDGNGMILWANKAELDMLGYTKEEYVGHHISEFHTDTEKIEDILNRLCKNETITQYESELKCKDGSVRCVLINSNVLWEDGKFIHTRCFTQDITDRKIAEKALRESEQRYRNLLHGLPAAVYTTDKDGYITMYNEAAAQLWGRQPVVGKDPWCGSWKIYYPDGITPMPLDKCPMAKTLKEGRSILGEEIIIERPDGTRRIVLPHPEPIFDSSGKIVGAVNMLLDITERKTTEEQSTKLAAIVQSSDDAIISKTLNGIITSWNTAAERIFGYTEKEMIGQSVTKLIPDDRKDEEPRILERLKKGERVDHFETKRLTKKGELIDISLTISPVKNLKGEIIGASKIARDITAQKQISEILSKTEEQSAKLAAIVQSSEDAIVSKTLDGIVMSWNPGAERIFGYTAEEMIGQHITKLIPKDLEHEEPKILARLRKGERVEHFETKRITKDGKILDISLTISPVKDSKGRLIGASKIARDITFEKILRERIEDNELLLKTISAASPAALWMTDKNGQNVFVNETWIRWTGIPHQQQLEEGWTASIVEEDRSSAIEEFIECSSQKKYYNYEFRFLRADGEIRWGLTEGHPYYDIHGNYAGYAGSVTDISEIKKLEQRKDDFIKMASHELKTPITSINGYVQLLLNIYNELDNEKLQTAKGTVKSSLGTIAKQVSKLTRLITELLDLSKIESGKLELHRAEFNLSDLVEETVQDLRQTTSKHAIIVQNDFEGKINGDKDRIGQVITNLLNNAIKYSPDSDNIEVCVDGNSEFAIIRVKDFGIGIDKKDHEKIFERFYRAEGKSEQTYPGFGIGLFIASEIISRHHGSISVKSEKGHGAEFTIAIPVKSKSL